MTVMIHQIMVRHVGVFVFDTEDEVAKYIDVNKLQPHQYVSVVVSACDVIRNLQKALAGWEIDHAKASSS